MQPLPSPRCPTVVQADMLRNMAKYLTEADSAVQYRLHAFQMDKGMYGMLRQPQVGEFWRYLSVEARDVHSPEPAFGVRCVRR